MRGGVAEKGEGEAEKGMQSRKGGKRGERRPIPAATAVGHMLRCRASPSKGPCLRLGPWSVPAHSYELDAERTARRMGSASRRNMQQPCGEKARNRSMRGRSQHLYKKGQQSICTCLLRWHEIIKYLCKTHRSQAALSRLQEGSTGVEKGRAPAAFYLLESEPRECIVCVVHLKILKRNFNKEKLMKSIRWLQPSSPKTHLSARLPNTAAPTRTPAMYMD